MLNYVTEFIGTFFLEREPIQLHAEPSRKPESRPS